MALIPHLVRDVDAVVGFCVDALGFTVVEQMLVEDPSANPMELFESGGP